MIRVLTIALLGFGLLVSGIAFAEDTPSQQDDYAQQCLPIIHGHSLQDTPGKGDNALLSTCAAVQACQSHVLDAEPQCALKLNTWVFALNVPPPPGGGNKLSSSFRSTGPSLGSVAPAAALESPPVVQAPAPPSRSNKDNQNEQSGFNWF